MMNLDEGTKVVKIAKVRGSEEKELTDESEENSEEENLSGTETSGPESDSLDTGATGSESTDISETEKRD